MLYETLNIKSNDFFGLQDKVIKSGTTTMCFLLMTLYRKFIQFYFRIILYLLTTKKVVVKFLTTLYNIYEVMNNMVVVLFFLPNDCYFEDFSHFTYRTYE